MQLNELQQAIIKYKNNANQRAFVIERITPTILRIYHRKGTWTYSEHTNKFEKVK